ncbi:MAG: histidinol-phosphate transaminase [Candidatus Omnitrophica bacterium]|nr:histidinol-phosphate transaminase [Candidatus Omnitrophota bacterium]
MFDARVLARACVRESEPYKPGKPIEELKRELRLSVAYKMASNENALGPSPAALAAVRRVLREAHRYPDGACFSLKAALARNSGIPPEQLVVGNGSDELIVLALRAFINPGDEVIIAEPTFMVYKIAARLCEAQVIAVPLRDFRYDLAAMRQRISPRTKMIFIANPDNPTGSYAARAAVEEFLAAVPEGVLVFFDEAYYEYVEAADYATALPWIGRGNVIVSRSFSKIYGLGGLRVGWAAAAEPIIDCLNRVREPFNVNSLAQAAAVAALDDLPHIERSRSLVGSEKEFLCATFGALGLFFVPSVTNFILVRVGEQSEAVYHQLLRQGVIVREMAGWGLPGFIRVTIGKKSENRLFARRLRQIIRRGEA